MLYEFIHVIKGSLEYAPGEAIADGEIHRFATNDKAYDKAGWYILFDNGGWYYGIAGDWREGDVVKWNSKGDFRTLTHEEQETARRNTEEAKKKREAIQLEAMRQALDFVASLENADASNPYLMKKHVQAYGWEDMTLKKAMDENGNEVLVMPYFNADFMITGYQRIWPDGAKRFARDCKVQGSFFSIGYPGNARWICEGYATGASIHEATGDGVIIALNCGNIKAVADALKAKNADINLTVVADNDGGKHPGEECAKASGLPYVLIPEDGKDANDYAVDYGVEALKKLLNDAPNTSNPPSMFTSILDVRGTDTQWQIEDLVPVSEITELYAVSGAGKSFLAIDIALSILHGGGLWHDGHAIAEAPDDGAIFYLYGSTEGTDIDIKHRVLAKAEAIAGRGWINKNLSRFRLYDLYENPTLLLNRKLDIETLEQGIDKSGYTPLAIVVDTLIAHFVGDENTSKDIQPFMRNLGDLAKKYKCAVLLVHHQGKPGSDGIKKGNDRGSSAIEGGCFSRLMIDGSVNDGHIVVRHMKNRAGKRQADFYLKPVETVVHDYNPDTGEYKEFSTIYLADMTQDEIKSTVHDEVETVDPKLRADAKHVYDIAKGFCGGLDGLNDRIGEDGKLTINKVELRNYLKNNLGWAGNKPYNFVCQSRSTNELKRLEKVGWAKFEDDDSISLNFRIESLLAFNRMHDNLFRNAGAEKQAVESES